MLFNSITRLFFCSLVFLYTVIFLGCKSEVTDKQPELPITIKWENGKAVSFEFAKAQLLNDISDLELSLTSADTINPILGDFMTKGDSITFKPLIPFTPSLEYGLYKNGKAIGSIRVPLPKSYNAPYVSAIYPSNDTVPENLLKMYFFFSEPMQQIRSLDYIKVVNKNTLDTVDVFLELQPELWNANNTRLTLWLDPGRVKTDLIPNKTKGLPIVMGNTYELLVLQEWKDERGFPLSKTTSKIFFVSERDRKKPNLEEWKVAVPANNSRNELKIFFNDVLDAVLLQETIVISNADGTQLQGEFLLSNEEKEIRFIPEKEWISGTYIISVEAKLEDLSGNNLNRLFDSDLTSDEVRTNKEVFKRKFHIN